MRIAASLVLPLVSALSLDHGLTTGSQVDGLALSAMAQQGVAGDRRAGAGDGGSRCYRPEISWAGIGSREQLISPCTISAMERPLRLESRSIWA